MEFISAEEFLKQPIEVQKVFLDWWKPSFGDLFSTKVIYDEIDVIIETTENAIWGMNINFYDTEERYVSKILKPFPLLTEGQLRKFIEDNCLKIEIQSYEDGEYTLTTFLHGSKHKQIDCDKLLQAYWKVALEIAKEKVQHEV